MAIHDLSGFQHNHAFDPGNRAGERRTWVVVALTAATMVAEIAAGILTGSMALLADGWHMATHVVALTIAGVAYLLARRWARDERFAFGTWKIEVLGAFSSALLLGVVAAAMIWESAWRLVRPEAIQFGAALVVAGIGLAVNIVSALVLQHGPGHDAHHHDHDHGHEHAHEHGHHGHAHHDLNLKSAYVHVLTDALTSVLAIVALAAGWLGGWTWLDPAMGIVGALVIAWWARGLIAESARVLLDREMDSPLVGQIRTAIQSDGDAEICDLHVWRVGRESYAAVVTVVAERPLTPAAYRDRIAGLPALVHVSVEVNRCGHQACP
jgi:cation diffusion facilitator family transporter